MSEVFALASDFIERMSNPGYGIRVNEDYSMRLGTLLSSERFESLLRSELEQLREPESFTPHGWFWLLSLVRSKEMKLNDDLLFQLAELFASAFMQIAVIDVATQHVDWRSQQSISTVEEFDHPWLSELLRRRTEAQSEEGDAEHVDTKRAETMLIALMQIGREVTLDAARTLLNHQWIGQPQLVKFFWSLCDELDDETRRLWVSRLRPPDSPSDEFPEGGSRRA